MNLINKLFSASKKELSIIEKVVAFINDNQDDNFCKERLAKEFNISIEDSKDIIFKWAIGDKTGIEAVLTKPKVIWSGTISSDGPEQQGPITVLALRTEFDKSEWDEGCTDALIDFNTGKEMQKNLNYPVSPYARGYIEIYRGLSSKKTNTNDIQSNDEPSAP